jgi:hypothetical protein
VIAPGVEYGFERCGELEPAVQIAALTRSRSQCPADHRALDRGIENHTLFVHGASVTRAGGRRIGPQG